MSGETATPCSCEPTAKDCRLNQKPRVLLHRAKGKNTSVHLQRIRLLATSKDQADAGADAGVMLWYYVTSHVMTTSPTKGWNSQEFTRPWKDRERGRTEV